MLAEGSYVGIYWDMAKQTDHGEYEKCWLTDALATEEVPDDILPTKALNTKDVVSLVLLFLRQRGRDGYDAAYRVCYCSRAGLWNLWKPVDTVTNFSSARVTSSLHGTQSPINLKLRKRCVC